MSASEIKRERAREIITLDSTDTNARIPPSLHVWGNDNPTAGRPYSSH